MDKKKTIIIGLDGVPFGLLSDLANREVMPNTKKVIEEGVFKKMQSSIPEISSVAWSSVITGKNPAEHNIYGFTDIFPNTYKLRFPNYASLKADSFWQGQNGKYIIVNVPSTYPVREMNGVHISGFVSLDFQRSVYPKEIIPDLKELGYRIDVDSSKAHKSMDLFLRDLDRTLDARIKGFHYLWDKQDWQTFMFVFTGIDRLMHFLWQAYRDENHKYHNNFINHFKKIDKVIGKIFKQINQEDKLVMLSDHGFEKLDKDININYLLKERGFLGFNDKLALKNISSRTKAFALDPARIYLNKKNKFSQGVVSKEDEDNVLKKLEELFLGLEFGGKKVVKEIYRKGDIYSGPFIDNAPDLVLIGNKGFNLKSNIKAESLFTDSFFTGKHTQDDAFLLVKGLQDDKMPDYPSVTNVRALIE